MRTWILHKQVISAPHLVTSAIKHVINIQELFGSYSSWISPILTRTWCFFVCLLFKVYVGIKWPVQTEVCGAGRERERDVYTNLNWFTLEVSELCINQLSKPMDSWLHEHIIGQKHPKHDHCHLCYACDFSFSKLAATTPCHIPFWLSFHHTVSHFMLKNLYC